MIRAVLFDLDRTLLDRDTSFASFAASQFDHFKSSLNEVEKAELDEYDKICREAMKHGYSQWVPRWRAAGANQQQAAEGFKRAVHTRYLWVSESNLSPLFSQGCYYAWKDGEI